MIVKSVKTVKNKEKQKFYDIEIEDNHNFCIKPYNESLQISTDSVIAHNCSFGLLYMKTVAAIADDYFRGDVKYAQKLFDDFFEMFPNVKLYIERQKAMLLDKGYVTTVFGDAIHLPYDSSKLYYSIDIFLEKFKLIENKEEYPKLCNLYNSYINGKLRKEEISYSFPKLY